MFGFGAGSQFDGACGCCNEFGRSICQRHFTANGQGVWNYKDFFDSSFVLLSAGLSFVFFGKIVGVREGTIIAALLSGFIIRFFNRLFGSAVENWLTGSKEEKKMRTDAK